MTKVPGSDQTPHRTWPCTKFVQIMTQGLKLALPQGLISSHSVLLTYCSHEYRNISDGKIHVRMRFYIQGPNGKGTVNLEMVEVGYKVFTYCMLGYKIAVFKFGLQN